jgi:hypothetical protein
MTYLRLPYDDAASATEMAADCSAVSAALGPVPSIRYEDYPREVPKPTIEISAAASRLAAAISQD